MTLKIETTTGLTKIENVLSSEEYGSFFKVTRENKNVTLFLVSRIVRIDKILEENK